jgi:hypothetical protein
MRLELCEGIFDRIEVGTIGRQIEEFGAAGLNSLPDAGDLVGGLVFRANQLPLFRAGIVARHGTRRSILTLLGIGIVLERFARADKLPLPGVGIVARYRTRRSILMPLGVGVVLECLASRSVLVPIGVRTISRPRLCRR